MRKTSFFAESKRVKLENKVPVMCTKADLTWKPYLSNNSHKVVGATSSEGVSSFLTVAAKYDRITCEIVHIIL